jgi:hypothetical protein
MQRMALLTAALLCLIPPSTARADDWDLNLSRLCQFRDGVGQNSRWLGDCGGGTPKGVDPSKMVVIPDNAAFRSLMSELGVVFAPGILSPSDTQGYNGTNFSVDFGWTMINPKKLNKPKDPKDPNNPTPIEGQNYFWRAARQVQGRHFAGHDVTTNPGTNVALDNIKRELPSTYAPTVSVMARKGLWLPVPSFELAAGVKHLIGSRMWAPTVMAKLALHEGFQGWPLPAFAIRGTGVRVVGSPDFNLTIAGIDFSISKHFGVASTFNLTPYVGYQLLWIIADSEVLDATPEVDAMAQTAAAAGGDPLKHNRCGVQDCNGNFTFADQANITRHRAFFGIKANFFVASILLEYSLFASGGTSDKVALNAAGLEWEYPDESGFQQNISFSLQLDF